MIRVFGGWTIAMIAAQFLGTEHDFYTRVLAGAVSVIGVAVMCWGLNSLEPRGDL